ncbi:glutaryl-CoA dehydrogenase [Strigomonas culicis]|uniref:glutaryl-CoA dehydrogenase (ETF) n=1 Tax=Strigomonas culicis TaxID=28005 RepID=S9W8N9_9TRYP|nr:glutaryl-CoA dehydrogenase [Strigomonas culicis]|eukprot:EPY32190.1 glutaryl-CoA dehydrogenase [Strigomonas culicis]
MMRSLYISVVPRVARPVVALCAARRAAATKYMPFQLEDPMCFQEQLTPEERDIQKVAHDYCQRQLLPRIVQANREETVDTAIFKELGGLGLLGATIDGYGCSGVSNVANGLISVEVKRVDSAYRSAWSVQSSLVMHPIYAFGSEAQKAAFLPRLASGELIGCFGLTEPSAGSDPAGMRTRARRVDGGYVLNGEKMWITSAPLADVAVVWAREVGGSEPVRGFLVERGFKGFETPAIKGKLSLRASCTGAIQLTDCFVPDANVLSGVTGLKGPLECLSSARLGIAWGMIGAAEACFDAARAYTLQRRQFDRPLAANQLVQLKLADMLSDITYMQQASLRAARLKDEGKLSHEVISILKRRQCGQALHIARTARDMLGGNGITEEYHVMRHVCNLETTNTYEGTSDVHGLILGRAITGISAF